MAAIADVAMRRLFAPEYQTAHPELIAERKARFLAVDPRTFHAACAALAALDLREQLASVRTPALVVVGEMDEATPPAMRRSSLLACPRRSCSSYLDVRTPPSCKHRSYFSPSSARSLIRRRTDAVSKGGSIVRLLGRDEPDAVRLEELATSV